MCCPCCTVKVASYILAVAYMIGGAGIIFLGIEFSSLVSTRYGNETILGIGLDAYGGFFILLGAFGMWVS